MFFVNAGKVDSPKSAEPSVFTPVRFNEIDINQHFNTGRFIERVMDSFSFGFHEKYQLKEFEINFLKEGMTTDNLAVIKQQTDKLNYLCSVIRESDGSELIRSGLVWEER